MKEEQSHKLERLYTDASYYDGFGGMAVVAPSWAASCVGKWRERWDIRTETDDRRKGLVIFVASCRCSDSSDAEKRAIGMAFLLANDILSCGRASKVEIVSDSLCVLDSVVNGDIGNNDHVLISLRNIWLERRIILSKVKAHNGHPENELADKWAKRARRQTWKKQTAQTAPKSKDKPKQSKEDKANMRMPFTKNNGYDNRNKGGRPNPFAGSSEMDIRKLTEQVLNDENNIGYVTPEGKVMPRNMAFGSGNRNGIELVKQRIWGGENPIVMDDADLDDGDGWGDEDGMDEMNEMDELGEMVYDEAEADGDGPSASSPVEVVYSVEARRSIARESLNSPGLETGGALIGNWERNVDGRVVIHVQRATGPGPDSTRRPALFSPHLDYYRSRVAYYREANGWDYLGEWHKHPGGFSDLSGTDIETARSLIRDEGWPLLLLPIVNDNGGRLTMENNVIFSPQLFPSGVSQQEDGLMTRVSGMEIDEPPEEPPVTAYLDAGRINAFRAAGGENDILGGICNDGESYVFLDIPGLRNAAAKLVHDEVGQISGLKNVVTVLVGSDSVRCYHAKEGEILPLRHVLMDAANTIYERNAGLTETTALKNKSVTLVGCGSLGSTLALSLARAGVGRFRLFDPDRLSPVNIARHQADLSFLGRNKAAVLRDLIRRVNPTISVEAFAADIVNSAEGFEAFSHAAENSDLLICTTDTDDSRMLVNETAVRKGIKALQAGLHERAISGIVHLYDPLMDEGCFACRRDSILSESDKRAEGVAYSEARDVRDLTIQPGLAAQINIVAEVAALRSIDALMDRKSLPSLTLVYIDRDSTAETQDKRRLSLNIRHLELPRVPACPVCEGRELREGGTDYDKEDTHD